jgi:hypothetical protein
MALSRRSLFSATLALPAFAAAAHAEDSPRSKADELAEASAAPVKDTLTDYPMAADPSLVGALKAAAALYRGQTGIFVHILPTAPALLVPQMTHQIQNDVVMARTDIIAELDHACCFIDGAPRPRFANSYVLVGRDTQSVAFTDISAGRPRDELAILKALGLGDAKRVGVIDGLDAASMVASGAVGAALIRRSELAATPGLMVLREVPASIAEPDIYIATVTRAPIRPKPNGFVRFLTSPAGIAVMAQHGLEHVA